MFVSADVVLVVLLGKIWSVAWERKCVMGDWSEVFFDTNGVEISAEGFIMGADENVVELHVMKRVGEDEWSVEGSEEFLESLCEVSGEFVGAENQSEEFYYSAETVGCYIVGGEEQIDAEIARLRGIAERVMGAIS